MGVGLYFLFLLTYITYALIFFLPKMKDDLTSGMPENIEVIVCLFCFGIWGFFKNNQNGIFWYCFKMSIDVFQHFTLSDFLSCGNYLSLSFLCYLM